MSKTKLLIHSNAPWAPTGYGQQVALFAPMLREHYDVAISAFYGLQAAPIVWDGMRIFPGSGGNFGNEVLVAHAAEHFGGDPKAGIVMTICDVWPIDPHLGEELNMCCWCPVDHQPVPERVWKFLADSGAVPIAMTRFGEQQLGLLDPLYVPHGVNTAVYRPHEKRKARRGAFPDDAFVVGMVAANKGYPARKAFPEALAAFAQFAKEHDNAYLYLHTTFDVEWGQGVDIGALVTSLGIPWERIRKADQYGLKYVPTRDSDMATIYSALDVLLAPSYGEGFGVPVLEAASCSVPSIVTDWTAMPEVQGGAGWQVGGVPWWTPSNTWQRIPDIGEIHGALEACYRMSPAERASLGDRARRHAEGYDARRVLREFMLPALRGVEQRFSHREPVRIPSRLESVAA